MYTLKIISKDGEMSVPVNRGERLLDAARRSGAYIDAPCGGRGVCGKCVVLAHGALSPAEEQELEFLNNAGLDVKDYRLACLAEILGDCIVHIGEESGIVIEKSFMQDGEAPAAAFTGTSAGAAVDIGTTTVAVSLFDLESKSELSSEGILNPQRPYGADVVSRIGHIREDGSLLFAMKTLISDGINKCVLNLCKKTGVAAGKIEKYIISGNTAMECILAGINTDSLGEIPYAAPDILGREFNVNDVGLLGSKAASAYFAPCIAGYVGGDITSGILACGLDAAQSNTMLIDVGTNGEMALKTKDGIFCCATAAGPCFEGANISLGMGASDGAVSRVCLSDGKILFDTIGDKSPCGICGSGIIDAAAAFLALGLIDETGRVDDEADSEHIFEKDGEACLKISETVYLTQTDIRQIQLAKAAVNAGIRTLCLRAEVSLDEIDSVFLAGGFGNHIGIESAIKIGLLPSEFLGKIISAGNTSLRGSKMALIKSDVRGRLEKLAKNAKYLELSTDPEFSEEYINQMMF